MKQDLTTRQKTIQMLLERWRQKQDEKEVGTATPLPLFAQKPRFKIDKTRRQAVIKMPRPLKID
jgi:hypothetical protein